MGGTRVVTLYSEQINLIIKTKKGGNYDTHEKIK